MNKTKHFLNKWVIYGRTYIENSYYNFGENDDISNVYPNIYISNYSTSTNLKILKENRITHIISAIPKYDKPFPELFNYLHIPVYDDDTQHITSHFDKTNKFIEDALNANQSVLIHCMEGRSRSVSIFIAFLIDMIKKRKAHGDYDFKEINSLQEEYNKIVDQQMPNINKLQLMEKIMSYVKTHRQIAEPNSYFMGQLIDRLIS